MTSSRGRLPSDWRAWPAVFIALLLLNASLTFGNVWPTPQIRWQNAVSIELAVCVVLLAAVPRSGVPRVVRALPAVWLLLVIGRYLDVTAPALYGRAINLYWDAPHVGNVVAMMSEAAPPSVLFVAALATLLLLAAAYLLTRTALLWLADAVTRRPLRPVLVSLAVLCVGLFAVQRVTAREPVGITFAEPVTPSYARQVRSVLAMMGPRAVAPTLGPTPEAFAKTPGGLAGTDIYLVFVESYGAVTFETPAFAAALERSRAAFEAAARDTRRFVMSAYVESPTFGASSWLAHLSLISGIDVRDQYSYQSLMTEQRETFGTTLARAGYRTVALMPGMRQAWPEGAFYRYDAMYGRADLEYAGPRFGWWSIPDQYALAKLDAIEGPPGTRPPLFVVFPTSTTHAPFGPVPPYQPQWSKILTADAFEPDEVQSILARPPDLTNLADEYLRAMSYEFHTFAGYLRERKDRFIMILVGDHQPPAAVAGKDAPWTVPVHVVTSETSIRDRLSARGFEDSLTPIRPSLGDMHELAPLLLDAFSTPD